jgi:hypothetical protein
MVKKLVFIGCILFWLLPLCSALYSAYVGNFAFWYDPARDLLLAADNLKKVTLLGPPSGGIPGLFYGPYWIWLLSLSQLISKDPRLAVVLAGILPYFFLFPYLLYKFSRIFGKKNMLLLWALFIFGFSGYAVQLWNPNLGPVLFLTYLYFMVFAGTKSKKQSALYYFLGGLFAGFLINFHISFGIVVILGSCVFIGVDMLIQIIKKKDAVSSLLLKALTTGILFCLGIFITLIPFLVFELRHQFMQSLLVMHALQQSFLYNSAVTGGVGLTDADILMHFIGRLCTLLQVPLLVTIAVVAEIGVYSVKQNKKTPITYSSIELRLLLLLCIFIFTLLLSYLTAKNPVWEYHFVGVEILYLLLVGFVLKKLPQVQTILSVWVVILFLQQIVGFTAAISFDPLRVDSYVSDKQVVEGIYGDANKSPFAVYAFNPAIYTYNYDYLFKWLGKDTYGYLPENYKGDTQFDSVVYLIIPKISKNDRDGYVNFKTPNKNYTTTKTWNTKNNTTIIRREKVATKYNYFRGRMFDHFLGG